MKSVKSYFVCHMSSMLNVWSVASIKVQKILMSIDVKFILCKIVVCHVHVSIQTSASVLEVNSLLCTQFLCFFVIAPLCTEVVCIFMTLHAESLGLISSPDSFTISVHDLEPAHFRHLNTVGILTNVTRVR